MQQPSPKRRRWFQFSLRSLLLLMLADCGAWYERFYKTYRQGKSHKKVSELAARADLSSLLRVEHLANEEQPEDRERYPEN